MWFEIENFCNFTVGNIGLYKASYHQLKEDLGTAKEYNLAANIINERMFDDEITNDLYNLSFMKKKQNELRKLIHQKNSLLQQFQSISGDKADLLDKIEQIEKSMKKVQMEMEFYTENLERYIIIRELIFPQFWFFFYWIIVHIIKTVIVYMICKFIAGKNHWNTNMSYVNNIDNSNIAKVANAVQNNGAEERNINTGGGEYRETTLHDGGRYIETRDSSTYYENYNQSQQTLTAVATKIEQLLDYFEQNDPSITQAQQIVKTATEEQPEILDVEIVQNAIDSSPTLKQRIGAAGTAAYIETVKLLLPPLSIAIEAFKAYKNPE